MPQITILFPRHNFEFTMSNFKRYSFNNKFFVSIFFSSCQYARTSVKIQHVENIEFLDEIKVVGNTFKTLLLSNPFDGKGNYFHFSRKGNNFENISLGKNLFFVLVFRKYRIFPILKYYFSQPEKKMLKPPP